VALNSQAEILLDQLARLDTKPLEEMAVEEARQTLAAFTSLGGAGPEMASVEDMEIPSVEGGIHVRLYRPRDRQRGGAGRGGQGGAWPVLVWLHGGGWVLGSLEDADAISRRLAEAADVAVANVEYRLAPEHPFPAAVDDCAAVVRWLAQKGSDLGLDSARLAIGGDSAGANLAAVTAQGARDHDLRLGFQLLVYPPTDASMASPSIVENGEGYLLTKNAMAWFWDLYLGSHADRRDPRASPAASEDLAGLPPALVITAEYDPLRDEGELYGRRLAEAGVSASVHRFDGVIHGFFTGGTVFDAAGEAVEEAGSALRKALGGP
jgi:acetyl esterase/lipase